MLQPPGTGRVKAGVQRDWGSLPPTLTLAGQGTGVVIAIAETVSHRLSPGSACVAVRGSMGATAPGLDAGDAGAECGAVPSPFCRHPPHQGSKSFICSSSPQMPWRPWQKSLETDSSVLRLSGSVPPGHLLIQGSQTHRLCSDASQPGWGVQSGWSSGPLPHSCPPTSSVL